MKSLSKGVACTSSSFNVPSLVVLEVAKTEAIKATSLLPSCLAFVTGLVSGETRVEYTLHLELVCSNEECLCLLTVKLETSGMEVELPGAFFYICGYLKEIRVCFPSLVCTANTCTFVGHHVYCSRAIQSYIVNDSVFENNQRFRGKA